MKKKTLGTIAIVAALVAVLAVPVFAQAARSTAATGPAAAVATTRAQAKAEAKAKLAAKKAQRAADKAAAKAAREAKRAAKSAAKAMAKGQRQAQLQKRIGNKLNARKHRFDAASANLNKRIDRLAALATTVAAAGGDVSGVNAKLDIARQHLANALALEQTAIAKFQAIPAAADRKAAFVEARAAGRAAVAELKVTRVAIRDAAAALRLVVTTLPSVTPSETVNAQ